MFSKDTTETKIAVLEERLTSYEAMLKKIDQAIQLLGQTSQDISKMLAVHEEKLDNNVKNDHDILEQIKNIELKNTQDHATVLLKFGNLEDKIDQKIKQDKKELEDKIVTIENKIDDLNRTKYIAIGMAIITSLVVTVVSQLAGGIFVNFTNIDDTKESQKVIREVQVSPQENKNIYLPPANLK